MRKKVSEMSNYCYFSFFAVAANLQDAREKRIEANLVY